MNITFNKLDNDKYEIKMTGRLDECGLMIEALENSVGMNNAIQAATTFMRKKLNEHRRPRG